MTFKIRDATLDDLPAVGKLAGDLVRLHRDYDARRWMCPEGVEEGYTRYFTSQLGREGTLILVAEEEQTRSILGYTYATREARDWMELREACGRLHDLYVLESARRQGIGAGLIREAIRRLKALGETQLVFTSAWQNTVIRDVLGAMGFRPTSVEMTMDVV